MLKKDQEIASAAMNYVLENKDDLIKQFVLDKKPIPGDLLTFFMAGSPGAGKTEFSRRYVKVFWKKQFLKFKKNKKIINSLKSVGVNVGEYDRLFIAIDVDEIREFLPQYKKTDKKMGIQGNAHIINSAATKGLDILRKYCLANSISFVHDGTFGNQYSTSKKLIKKSLKLGRQVQIFYIYMDPIVAWKFTQEREYVEGRNIKKANFINQFYQAMENVDRAKVEFGSRITLHCILKKEKKSIEEVKLDVDSIANFLEARYTKNVIKKYNKEDLESQI